MGSSTAGRWRSGWPRASSGKLADRVEARGLDVDEESVPAGHGRRGVGMVLKDEGEERTGVAGGGRTCPSGGPPGARHRVRSSVRGSG